MWRPTRPVRQYKSLEDFRQQHCPGPEYRSDVEYWPCLECRGRQVIYDPNDPPCPIEGNKMRRVIPCPKCSGTGKGPRALVAEAFKEYRARVAAKLAEWNRLVATYKEARKKLSDVELSVLLTFGSEFPGK